MKPLLLALVLSGAVNPGSLDIGLDVLPEAFTFAAHRVGFTPVLRLAKCTPMECLWDLGYGVEVTANHRGDDITVERIEAKLRPMRPAVPEAMRQFEQACLMIVALVDRDGGAAQQRATAKAITASGDVQFDLPDRNIRFYGTRSTSMTQDKQDVVLRCGVTANS